MKTTCKECDRTYDDVYHWTYCPHDYFQMRTVVVRPGKPDAIASTVEELDMLMANDL